MNYAWLNVRDAKLMNRVDVAKAVHEWRIAKCATPTALVANTRTWIELRLTADMGEFLPGLAVDEPDTYIGLVIRVDNSLPDRTVRVE